MAKAMKRVTFLFAALTATAVVVMFNRLAFVPPARSPTRFAVPTSTVGSAAAAAAMLTAVPAAHADKVDDAATRLADTVYPVFQRFNWAQGGQFLNYLENANWDARSLVKAEKAVLQLGMAASRADVVAAVTAHEKALQAAIAENRMLSPNGVVAPLLETEEIFRTIARLLVSAGSEKSMAVYEAVNALGVPAFYTAAYGAVGQAEALEGYKVYQELVQEGSWNAARVLFNSPVIQVR